jgi:hypothetical protein
MIRRLPHRWAPTLFGLILSGIMTAVVSFVATLNAVGFNADLPYRWAIAWPISWAVAFPVILKAGPAVRRLVARAVEPPPEDASGR